MNWQQIVVDICELCIYPILAAAGVYVVNYLRHKSANIKQTNKNNEVQSALLLLNNAVENAVLFTKQTYVDSLKKNGTFDAAAQKVAYELTYAMATAAITEDTKKALSGIINDLPKYINGLIEAKVHMTK